MKYYIPNFTPAYGALKEVLMTKKERADIGLKKTAQHLAKSFVIGDSCIIKSWGRFFKISLTEWGWKVGVGIPGRRSDETLGFPTYEKFVSYLTSTHTDCEIRRIHKMIHQRRLDRHSAGNPMFVTV